MSNLGPSNDKDLPGPLLGCAYVYLTKIHFNHIFYQDNYMFSSLQCAHEAWCEYGLK